MTDTGDGMNFASHACYHAWTILSKTSAIISVSGGYQDPSPGFYQVLTLLGRVIWFRQDNLPETHSENDIVTYLNNLCIPIDPHA